MFDHPKFLEDVKEKPFLVTTPAISFHDDIHEYLKYEDPSQHRKKYRKNLKDAISKHTQFNKSFQTKGKAKFAVVNVPIRSSILTKYKLNGSKADKMFLGVINFGKTVTSWHVDGCCSVSYAVLLEGEKKWELWDPKSDPDEDPPTVKIHQKKNETIYIPAAWAHMVTTFSDGAALIGESIVTEESKVMYAAIGTKGNNFTRYRFNNEESQQICTDLQIPVSIRRSKMTETGKKSGAFRAMVSELAKKKQGTNHLDGKGAKRRRRLFGSRKTKKYKRSTIFRKT
jgi:hypothetical protein